MIYGEQTGCSWQHDNRRRDIRLHTKFLTRHLKRRGHFGHLAADKNSPNLSGCKDGNQIHLAQKGIHW